MIIRKIPIQEKVRRVAAYARVSTLAEDQEESYETQVSYYTNLIGGTKGWTMVKVYADRGITGTSAAKRPGFMEMIQDAEDGKIDLILCKSVSRFSRNFGEAQKFVHQLKAKGVEVRFEKENLSSASAQTDMILGTMMAVAQQESKSISDNVKWTYRRLGQQGIRHVGNNHVLGYDEVDGKLTPNSQAWIVRLIFERYAEGAPVGAIQAELTDKGARTMRSGKPFEYKHIMTILGNELYTGDRLIQKKPPQNHLTKKPDPSQPYDSWYIRRDHEGIITKDLWQAVWERRNGEEAKRKAGFRTKAGCTPLYGKIVCGCCGKPYHRTSRRNKSEGAFKEWQCTGRVKGECQNRHVRETEILKAIGDQEAQTVRINEKSITVVPAQGKPDKASPDSATV